MRNALRLLTLLVFGLALHSCDKGSPVAPTGSILRMNITPDRISAFGTASITVEALRSTGNPVNEGTEIRLVTNIGIVEETILTDRFGIARGTLSGDGRPGTAKVTATSGAGTGVTVEVKVGSFPASISLQATPSTVPESGATVELLSLVRDDQGQALPGATVNFSAEKGTLASGGGFLTTDSAGQARDTLRLTAADLQTVSGNTFAVRVEAGGQTGSVLSQSFTLGIQRRPKASFTSNRSGLTVVFTDTSTGNPTDWLWEFGDPGRNTSRSQNPTFTYPAPGTYLVKLTASNASGSDSVTQIIAVTGN